MSFVPEKPSSGSSRSAYIETKDAVYHLMSSLEGLLPRIMARRERQEVFELLGRLERIVIELVLAEEFDEAIWGPSAPNGETEPGSPSGEAQPDGGAPES